ncbi:MAG: hypothetical protein D6731_21015 [Planctomycetota bacterium]|nr:MAG: hypothetical protein D6731_21015 [Planctomycetota bacterium]
MGLILDAACAACAFRAGGLRLGATHAEIGQHDVCTRELYLAPCCARVQSVRVFLGRPLPEVSCEECARPLPLRPEHRYRIATLKGEVFRAHPCPRCGARALAFSPQAEFR